MKRDLVIIPGAVDPKIASHPLAKPITKRVRKMIRVTPEIKFRYAELIKKMSARYSHVYFIDYDRDLFKLFNKSNLDIITSKLSRINNEYDAVCFSFGGHLIQEAIKSGKINNPKKIVLLFPVNLDKNIIFPKGTKVYNVYSTKDSITKQSNLILSLGKGAQHLKNANNIIINNMYHSEIESDKKIDSGLYKGLTGFQLVEKLLSI